MAPKRTIAFLSLLLAPLAAAQTAGWTLENPSSSPSARGTPGLAYDSTHAQVVLFGGASAGQFDNDTWVWDGANWTQKFPSTSPPARANHAMVYDSAHKQIVMFGGQSDSDLNDTWVWDGTNWTEEFPQTKPPARWGHAMAYDSAHGQVVMFGGMGQQGVTLNDTWVWDGTNWTQQSPQTSPPAADFLGMAYDSAHGKVVLFGGYTGNVILNSTWVWDGANWTQETPRTSPPARYAHAMAYDPVQGQVVLFGGGGMNNNINVLLNDTWLWDGTNWTPKNFATSPPARNRHSMAYDSAQNQTVLFGGRAINSAYDGDTWTWFGGPPPVPAPSISTVVSASAFGGFTSVAPGSWVEIYGSNLAPDTRPWSGIDFDKNNAPTSLDGVKVTIGDQDAFIDYISSNPGQVNAQLPSNITTGGTLQLTVTNGNMNSAPFNITVNATQPGLLAPLSFKIGGNQYVVAILPDGNYVLPKGSIAGVNSRPAKPGETVVMYGIGFGTVAPDFAAGTIVNEVNRLTMPFQLQFGQTMAKLAYDGLAPTFVGLYQFDVVVPTVPDNDLVPLTFSLGGMAGTQTLFTAVGQ